jgi:hypothetical protein
LASSSRSGPWRDDGGGGSSSAGGRGAAASSGALHEGAAWAPGDAAAAGGGAALQSVAGAPGTAVGAATLHPAPGEGQAAVPEWLLQRQAEYLARALDGSLTTLPHSLGGR